MLDREVPRPGTRSQSALGLLLKVWGTLHEPLQSTECRNHASLQGLATHLPPLGWAQ